MDIEDILKIVKESFDEEISSWSAETALGLESGIEGKEKFIEKVKEKLDVLFDDNDLGIDGITNSLN